jgi:hypothetical protein
MTGSRREWVILGALLLVLGISAALAGRGGGDAAEERPNASSYNPKGSGSKGLYLWLQALDVRVGRWERPLVDLPADAAVLLVIRPPRAVAEEELGALVRWVRGGGTLVLVDDAVGAAVPGIRPGPPALAFGLQGRPTGTPSSLRPAMPSRYVLGVDTVAPRGSVRFRRREPEGWAPLFADTGGDVVAVRRLGRGTVVAVSDPGIWSNAHLATAGHARLLLNIVQAHAGRRTVLVDEYHHGYGTQAGLTRYLQGTAIPWMLAQAALAFLVFALAHGTRFGAPAPPGGASRASSLEYVAALGDLHRRARARGLAAEALAASLRRRLTASLGLRAGADAAALAARAAARLGLRAAQVRSCLSPGAAAAESDERLLAFARSVHALERRLRRNGSSASDKRLSSL